MASRRDSIAESTVQAESRLARLDAQVAAMQAVLVRLLQDVAKAEHLLEQSDRDRLVEVNERLVVAALASQAEVETTARALREAEDASRRDALTGLSNRTALLDRFTQVLADARRQGSRFALMFLDLDDFKQLNDRCGHLIGDQVLRRAAERMLSVVREVDTVCRQGGDEFIVLLPGLQQPQDAQVVADKLVAAISTPMTLDRCTVSIAASVGIAVYPDDGDSLDALVSRADAAMYTAKRHRGGFARLAGPDVDAVGAAATHTSIALPSGTC